MSKNEYKSKLIKNAMLKSINDYRAISHDDADTRYTGTMIDVEEILDLCKQENISISKLTDVSAYSNAQIGGKLKTYIKSIIVKFVSWIINPIVSSQTTYNRKANYIDTLFYEVLSVYRNKINDLEMQLDKTETRLEEQKAHIDECNHSIELLNNKVASLEEIIIKTNIHKD